MERSAPDCNCTHTLSLSLPLSGAAISHAPQGTRKDILGLAWDMGAVTTGPVTVPLVISLGNGIAASVRLVASPPQRSACVTF
jgi:hypothetical protein